MLFYFQVAFLQPFLIFLPYNVYLLADLPDVNQR